MMHFKALIKDYNFHSCITACDYEDLRFEFNKQIIDKKIIKNPHQHVYPLDKKPYFTFTRIQLYYMLGRNIFLVVTNNFNLCRRVYWMHFGNQG